ncbi:hypothetical protein CBR_g23127 [Chara braunii]|uniref:Uncharacterized protein n=1 Tax=Chara braunii TaxID=69332 RepID=A0A388L3Y3_CHABU|nr:hypothetical protein CBR_g23127 [Chara braunii]|eukprot:GBG76913.1 hypothetical protein CBR_g23127 [Chara braunii]
MYENGWAKSGEVNAPSKRGVIHNKGYNLVTYIAAAKEVAVFLRRKGHDKIELDDGEGGNKLENGEEIDDQEMRGNYKGSQEEDERERDEKEEEGGDGEGEEMEEEEEDEEEEEEDEAEEKGEDAGDERHRGKRKFGTDEMDTGIGAEADWIVRAEGEDGNIEEEDEGSPPGSRGDEGDEEDDAIEELGYNPQKGQREPQVVT